nr:hypothetical protein [Tanacetum cinerariifolium]
MARSKNVYHHKMGRGGYVFVKEKMIKNKELEADEEPPHGIMWLKGRVNKDGEFTDVEIRSIGDKLKEADDKIKERTLNFDDGTDAMTILFGKEKGVIQEEWEVELHTRGIFIFLEADKQLMKELRYFKLNLIMRDASVNKKIQLMNQLAAQGMQLNLSSQLQIASDVTLMGAYEVDETQSSVVIRDKDARIQKKSNGIVTSEKEPIKTVGPKKTPNSRRNGSQDSQSQGNVSPTQELPTICTVYKSDGKQMLHNQALLNDCYKVPIDSSLVDAACISDVRNNGLKTVKDGVGGFFAWIKNQVVLDEEVTPPTTIQKISDYNYAPKLQSKGKNYVSRETMQGQARTGKSHKSLNYDS